MNTTRLSLIAGALILPASALAQPFDISWSSTDGGGATNISAGIYSLGGTVGQPEAGQVSAGAYQILSGFWGGSANSGSCYVNCDNSSNPPILNSLDFGCFLSKYAAGDPYANCDNSSNPPVLNSLDFGCFLTKFAAGCT